MKTLYDERTLTEVMQRIVIAGPITILSCWGWLCSQNSASEGETV